MEQLTKELWESMELGKPAASGSYDVTQDLPAAMRRVYPDMDFGFFSTKSLPGRLQDGWILMKPEWFNNNAYKSTVPIRHGLQEKDGAMWWHDLVLCVMPSQRHQAIEVALNVESERQFNAVVRGVAESKHAGLAVSEKTESSYEEKQVTIRDPEPAETQTEEEETPKRRSRGRPRKNPL